MKTRSASNGRNESYLVGLSCYESLCNTVRNYLDKTFKLLPVYSPTCMLENTTVTSMLPNQPQKPSEAPSAKGIARLTVHIPSAFRQKMPYNVGISHSRWSTVEFKFYYVVALFVIPVMVWIPMSLSLRKFSFLC